MVLAYPQIEWAPLVWVALVPLLLIFDGKSPRRPRAAFGWFYLCGLLFFFSTVGWFVYVTWVGAVALIAYLAVYFGLFGLAVKFFQPLPFCCRLLVLPSVWVGLEYARSHVITGFGWVGLGHSQYKNLLLIQIADLTGAYGVSFLIVLVNVLIAGSIKHPALNLRKAQIAVIGVLLCAFGYGFWRLAYFPQYPTVTVGVVQPNIPQELKWDNRLQPLIVDKTIAVTKLLRNSKADLIVWPETALPGVTSEVPHLMSAIERTAQDLHLPLLVGAITDEKKHYFNSAYLVSAKGELSGRYDKIHLVPFGEYMPLHPWLDWLNNFVGLEDFTSGSKYTILQAGPGKPFGVLICFEDTLGYLWRNFTNAGAGFLVNMTNDAWFKDTKAPFLHLQPAVFGCVENKRSLVRAANTGFSGFIDPLGRVLAAVHDGHGKMTFVQGVSLARVPVATEKTFYTKYGDVFTWACFLVILWGMAQRRRTYV